MAERDQQFYYEQIDAAVTNDTEWGLQSFLLSETLPEGDVEFGDTFALFPTLIDSNICYALTLFVDADPEDTQRLVGFLDHIQNLVIKPEETHLATPIDDKLADRFERELAANELPAIMVMTYEDATKEQGTVFYCVDGKNPGDALSILQEVLRMRREEWGI